MEMNPVQRFHWWADGEEGFVEAADQEAADAAIRYLLPEAVEIWIRPADEEVGSGKWKATD